MSLLEVCVGLEQVCACAESLCVCVRNNLDKKKRRRVFITQLCLFFPPLAAELVCWSRMLDCHTCVAQSTACWISWVRWITEQLPETHAFYSMGPTWSSVSSSSAAPPLSSIFAVNCSQCYSRLTENFEMNLIVLHFTSCALLINVCSFSFLFFLKVNTARHMLRI